MHSAAVKPTKSVALGRDDRSFLAAILLSALVLAVALLIPLFIVGLRSVSDGNGSFVAFANYTAFFAVPGLGATLWNSIVIGIITTIITTTMAFLAAYGLTRTLMPAKGMFKAIALIPLLAPSMLPAIAFVFLFGNQGFAKGVLFGHSIYGPIGIILGEVFYLSLIHI